MIKYIIPICFAFLVFFSCKSNKTENNAVILDIGEMVPVMFDMMAAGDLTYNDTTQATKLHLRDSTTIKFQSILAYYKIEKKRFFSSMYYYEENPEIEIKLIDSLQSYSSNILQKLEKVKNKKDSLERVKNQPQPDTAHKIKPALTHSDKIQKLDTFKNIGPQKLIKSAKELKKVK
ncbi:DUF4296 domain-containing protein [Rhizosphaericola mali]|uniref:DUF4296 domain-containing protein n=1 Tax=Rhizosphaericola mali TaxID=2545455 RepID=A0A5P2G6E0_9BACT|nr:DUF4296 domain-containing protein [Rhizosphaericola mali]QES89350.1 DUF4296 domain-containing protein [Rhizosphaericola mali]